MGGGEQWRGSERLGASRSAAAMHQAGPQLQPSVPESASQSPHLRPTDSKRGGGGAEENVSPGGESLDFIHTRTQQLIRGRRQTNKAEYPFNQSGTMQKDPTFVCANYIRYF